MILSFENIAVRMLDLLRRDTKYHHKQPRNILTVVLFSRMENFVPKNTTKCQIQLEIYISRLLLDKANLCALSLN